MTLNQSIGILITRLLLGFIFLMQGIGKVFSIGMDNMTASFEQGYGELLPDFLIYFAAYYTSYVELLGGALLVIGFKRDWALYALGLVLVIVTFGHGLSTPIWDLSDVMFRAVLLIPLLLLPAEWDKFSIDGLLRKRK